MCRTSDPRRDFVVSSLMRWGEFEAFGEWSARAQRSIIGRLIADGPGVPCSAPGPTIPIVGIPHDIARMGRVVAAMRAECVAGERYYAAIRARFVAGNLADEANGAVVLSRAIGWIVDAWFKQKAA